MFVSGEVAQITLAAEFLLSRNFRGIFILYWPDPAAGIKDIFRVLSDGGLAWMLINYYRDNPHCHQWGSLLAVPTLSSFRRRMGPVIPGCGIHERNARAHH